MRDQLIKKIAIQYAIAIPSHRLFNFTLRPASHGPRPGRIYPYNVVYLQE